MDSTRSQARLIGHPPFGEHGFNNCANSSCNSVTASCRRITLPSPGSGSGFRLSALATGTKRTESQLLSQRSVFESSRVLGSNGGQARLIGHLPFGADGFKNCANSRLNSVIASCHNSTLPTPSSGTGFRSSALDTGCIRKENQVQ